MNTGDEANHRWGLLVWENNDDDEALLSSLAFIDRRFNLNEDVNLLNGGFVGLESLLFTEDQANYLIDRRAELDALLGPDAGPAGANLRALLVRYMADAMNRRLVELSQYVNISQKQDLELIRIYEALVDRVLAVLREDVAWAEHYRALQRVILEHFRALSGFMSRLDDRDAFLQTDGGRRLRKLPCFVYTVPFQLEILGIAPAELREPILDLGCGEDGLLVAFLAERGLDAYGLDRHAKKSARLIKADWLSFQLEPEYWGTIISQMAFSNHFIHHLARKNGRPQVYARRFMAILDSLQPGGSFHYAPGLPFVECFLPKEKYLVERRRIEPEVKPARSQAGLLGEGLRYATRITRIG